MQDPADPQTFNRYAYARNNPILFNDPTGNYYTLPDVVVTGGGGGGALYNPYNDPFYWDRFYDFGYGYGYGYGGDGYQMFFELPKPKIFSTPVRQQRKWDVAPGFQITQQKPTTYITPIYEDTFELEGFTIHEPLPGIIDGGNGILEPVVGVGLLLNEKKLTINEQKQNSHVQGSKGAENRIKQGKPTSLFPDRETADKLTWEAWAKGDTVGERLNVREYDFGYPVGKGPRGGDQTKVRVHQDQKNQIHGHPSGPEK